MIGEDAMRPRIGLVLGDPAGIGAELAAKLLRIRSATSRRGATHNAVILRECGVSSTLRPIHVIASEAKIPWGVDSDRV